MTTIQSCNDCAKQSTCPKVANFENYRLDGCMDFVEKIEMKNVLSPEEANKPVTYGDLAVILQTIVENLAKESIRYMDKASDDIFKITDKLADTIVRIRNEAEYNRQRDARFMMGLIAQLYHCDKETIHKEYTHWCEEFDKLNLPQTEPEATNG